jgi:hypothetical protein
VSGLKTLNGMTPADTKARHMSPDRSNKPAAGLDHEGCTSRGFLVQLRLDADPMRGLFRGRVQHVRSGDAAHFDSLEELAGFIACRIGERPR